MLAQCTAQVKVRVGLGILMLVVGIVPVVYPYPVRSVGWILIVGGIALAAQGVHCHAREKGLQLSARSRWLLVFPVAAAFYAAIFIFLRAATWLVFDLAAICFAPRLDSVAADYPFVVVRLVLTAIAASYCLVVSGAKTAPKHRFMTAVVLGVCSLCANAYLLFGTFLFYNFGMWADIWTSELMWIYTPWAGGFVAVVLACAQVRVHESRLRRPQQGMSNNLLEPTRT